jgi:putative ABC transport system permease protein
MLWIENVRMALAAIWAHKLRSFLTVIGIVIGVGAVVAVQGILQGLTGIVVNQIQGLGSNTLIVQEYRPTGKEGEKLNRIELTWDDADAIKRLCPEVQDLAYWAVSFLPIKSGDVHETAPIVGTTASFQDVRNFYVDKGRFFSSVEDTHRVRVCVIGTQVIKDLKLKAEPVGQTMQVSGQEFRIIGVMEKRGELFGQSFDSFVLIPVSTAEALWGEAARKHIQILIRSRSDQRVEQTMDQITDTLRRRHELKSSQPDDFKVQSQAELLKVVKKITDGLAIGAAVIVGFALLVASIGVTNIMLVSVTERTREIGIRKAIGAKSQNIMMQFLVEAVTLCCFGGLVGIAFGLGLSLLGKGILNHLIPGWPPVSIPMYVYVLGVLIPAVFGVVAGMWPAYKAAKLDPIESLRYE